jgi:hypothetical protein
VKTEGGLQAARQSGESGQSGDGRTGSLIAPAAGPELRQSGQSGESGGCESESRVADRQRWGLSPGEEIPLATMTPTLRPADVELLTAHMKRQPPDVWQWIEDQAGRYARRDARRPRPDAFLAAALDCLLWQWAELANLPAPDRASRYDRIQEAVKLLRSLEEADRYFTEHPPAPAGQKTKGEQSA